MKEVDNKAENRVLTVKEVTDKFLSLKSMLLRHLMWNMHLSKDDADDLLQDVYYKILKNTNKFKVDTNFNAWCYIITKRLFIDKYRGTKNYKHVDVDAETLELMVMSDKNGSEDIFLKEDISNAIQSITNERDKKLAYMYYDGYKYDEMVEELKQPMGTIKNRLFHIKAHLAKKLAIYQ